MLSADPRPIHEHRVAHFDYQIWPPNSFLPEVRMKPSTGITKSLETGCFQPSGVDMLSGVELYQPQTPQEPHIGASQDRSGAQLTRITTGYPHDNILLAPYHYLLQNPGKGIRPAILDAFNDWLKVPKERLDIIKEIIEMLHGGSLLIDDIEDHSELRRGTPVAHKIYGMAMTINAANYVYFAALRKVQMLAMNDGSAGPGTQIFTEELLNAHRGQGLEIFWRENMICPTENQYLEMVKSKTSCLLRMGIALMVAYRGDDANVTVDGRFVDDLSKYPADHNVGDKSQFLEKDQDSILPHDYLTLCTTLGALFQIRDDFINLRSTKFAQTKGFCEDLTEGKFSFPMIHQLHHAPEHEREQLLHILRQRTNDHNLKEFALSLLAKSGSFEYTRTKLMELEAEARKMISKIATRSPAGDEKLGHILLLLGRDYRSSENDG